MMYQQVKVDRMLVWKAWDLVWAKPSSDRSMDRSVILVSGSVREEDREKKREDGPEHSGELTRQGSATNSVRVGIGLGPISLLIGSRYKRSWRASTVLAVLLLLAEFLLLPYCDLSFAELLFAEASCELPSAGLQLISCCCCWREVVASSPVDEKASKTVARFLHPEGVSISRFSGVSSTDGLIGFVHLTDTPRSRSFISEPRYIVEFKPHPKVLTSGISARSLFVGLTPGGARAREWINLEKTSRFHPSTIATTSRFGRDEEGEILEKKRWTKEQIHQSVINDEVMKIFEFSLPNDILCKIGGYNNAKELWNNLAKFHEGSSNSSHEEESSESSSSLHGGKELEVESYSTSKEEEEESSSSRLEQEEEASTSGRDEEESIHPSSTLGNSSDLILSKLHIICFECREYGHYKSKCLKRIRKTPPAPKVKEAGVPKRKSKEHVVCFQCKRRGHYRSQCPRGRQPHKDKRPSTSIGGAKANPKVSFKAHSCNPYKTHASNFIAIVNNDKHDNLRNRYMCLGAKHVSLDKDNSGNANPRITSSKAKENLGRNPKTTRHMPRNTSKKNDKLKLEVLEKENQVLRSRLDTLEKTLKNLEKSTLGSKGQKQKPKDMRGLSHKPKSQVVKPTYHNVPFNYGTRPRARKTITKVTRGVTPRVDLDESQMTKALKPRRVIRRVTREVIPSEYLVNPMSSNRSITLRNIEFMEFLNFGRKIRNSDISLVDRSERILIGPGKYGSVTRTDPGECGSVCSGIGILGGEWRMSRKCSRKNIGVCGRMKSYEGKTCRHGQYRCSCPCGEILIRVKVLVSEARQSGNPGSLEVLVSEAGQMENPGQGSDRMLSMMYQQVKVDRMLVWKAWDLVWAKTKLWIDQWIDPVIHWTDQETIRSEEDREKKEGGLVCGPIHLSPDRSTDRSETRPTLCSRYKRSWRASTVLAVLLLLAEFLLLPYCDLSFAELLFAEASCELPSAGLQLISCCCCWREVVASSPVDEKASKTVARFLHPEGVSISRFSGVSSTDGLIGFVHLTDTPRSRNFISEPRYIVEFKHCSGFYYLNLKLDVGDVEASILQYHSQIGEEGRFRRGDGSRRGDGLRLERKVARDRFRRGRACGSRRGDDSQQGELAVGEEGGSRQGELGDGDNGSPKRRRRLAGEEETARGRRWPLLLGLAAGGVRFARARGRGGRRSPTVRGGDWHDEREKTKQAGLNRSTDRFSPTGSINGSIQQAGEDEAVDERSNINFDARHTKPHRACCKRRKKKGEEEEEMAISFALLSPSPRFYGSLQVHKKWRAGASSPAVPAEVDLTPLEAAIAKKDSKAVKETLDQLGQIGWAKKWSSQPYVSRRMAAFLFTVVGTTGFLGVIAGQLPGDWGFFVPYLLGSISLIVLAIGSVSPGLLQAAIDGFSSFFPDYQERIARHESAHFLGDLLTGHGLLVAYLIGLPILGYSLDLGKEHVNLVDEKLQELIYSGQLDDKELDRLAVVSMAGLAAEGLKYDKVVGQSADLFTLQRFINRSKPQISKDQQQNLTRWAVLFAGSLLKNNAVVHEALMAAMAKKATVLECVQVIETAA
ncbi:hypothetical protein ZIOFF_006365 [Zingiber officinale]|uniref:CCHC-type domain-containing protein n=1 Tax=Zingiber officinale TaxID=94328 RepID=A0A8J5IE75_ZINOF|nr:hypothetical protein ZIOFF_006365 [Zingiber officinale]